MRLWGSSYLSANVVWHRDALQNALFVDGPFRYVRNPLYLGNDLQAVGIGILAPPIGWGIIVAGNLIFTAALAAHEAAEMQVRYGSTYDAYRRSVPAIVPRLSPARVAGSVTGHPSLRTGIRAELLTAGLAIGMIAVAIDGESALPLFGAIWFGCWLLQMLVRRGAPPERP